MASEGVKRKLDSDQTEQVELKTLRKGGVQETDQDRSKQGKRERISSVHIGGPLKKKVKRNAIRRIVAMLTRFSKTVQPFDIEDCLRRYED